MMLSIPAVSTYGNIFEPSTEVNEFHHLCFVSLGFMVVRKEFGEMSTKLQS